MYNNFGAPRNGFDTDVPRAGTSQNYGHVWPHQPPPQNYYQFPSGLPNFQEPPQFIPFPGVGFSNQPLEEAGAPTNEVTEQQLMAILSKYQLAKKPSEAPPKLNVS